MVKKYSLILPIIFSLFTNTKAANLDFLVQDTLSNPIQNSFVVVEGISNPNYIDIQQTDNSGHTIFDVPDDQFFYYSAFKQGFHSNGGAIYTDSNYNLNTTLTPFESWQWYDYYNWNGNVEFTFTSSDEDVNYVGGNEFNYEINFSNIGNEVISFNQNGLNSIVYDSSGNAVEGWGEQNPDLLYSINLNPGSGWFRAAAQGNNVTVYIGGANGNINGQNFDISGENEWVSEQITTSDNIVPIWLNGQYNVNVSLDYSLENEENRTIGIYSQPFYIDNFVSINPKENNLEKKVINFPNPCNNNFYVKSKDNGVLNIYNLRGQKIYSKKGRDFSIKSLESGIYIGEIDGEKFKQIILK